MTFIQFILMFMMLTAAGTLSVTGWFFITRGQEEVMPDGSVRRTGKVFKAWYFYWTRETGKRKVFYSGEQLDILLAEIRVAFYSLNFTKQYSTFTIENAAPNPRFDLEGTLLQIEKRWDIKISDSGRKNFLAYREYPRYRFPELIRVPLAECATCFSSIYGSVFYWAAISLPRQSLFAWAGVPWAAALFFWGVFCFSLSVLNTALAKSF